MLNLEQVYLTIAKSIPQHDRYTPILEWDDVIVVNFDSLYERDFHIRGIDQLLYKLHQIGQGRRFLFVSEDGANIRLSAVSIIENVISCFDLTKETCCLVCREEISINNCEVVTKFSTPYWCAGLYTTLKGIGLSQGPFNKKFAIWFHRGTFYRLELAKYLTEHYKDQSIVSYQESGVIVDRNMQSLYSDEIAWANEHTPIIYDQLFPDRVFDLEMIAGKRKPYNEYFIEIVAETDILTADWITEKTVKNLYVGKPFIVMSGVGTLERLHQQGFKTFSPWINESYDTIENIHLRLEAIKQEIDRLATVDTDQLHQELKPILEHNRKNYERFINWR